MKLFKRIWNLLTTLLAIVAVFLAVSLVGARLLGLQVFSVLSVFMEPTYHVGSLIYVKKVDPARVQVGDPITFVLNEDLVVATHRVIAVDVDENGVRRFHTKGDANNSPDGGTVHQENLLGEPVFTIPYLGFVSTFIQHPPGTYVAISAGAVLLLLLFLPELIGMFRESEEQKHKG